MDVFDLFAKISLDTSEYEKGLKDAKSSTGGLTDYSVRSAPSSQRLAKVSSMLPQALQLYPLPRPQPEKRRFPR